MKIVPQTEEQVADAALFEANLMARRAESTERDLRERLKAMQVALECSEYSDEVGRRLLERADAEVILLRKRLRAAWTPPRYLVRGGYAWER